MRTLPVALAALLPLLTPPASAKPARIRRPIQIVPGYTRVVNQVAAMVGNRQAQAMVRQKKLRILNVMWEDTGRWKGSSLGPNISDVTIEVHVPYWRRIYRQCHGFRCYPGMMPQRSKAWRRVLMPVIRYPNFTDKTADVQLDKIFIKVGNHTKSGRLKTISLKQFLAHPTRYMSFPSKGRIKGGSLLAKRDRHVLVSAQAAFLPIPTRGKAKFYPVIFNYQSYRNNPAVLTLLVTRQGTSMTIIDNARDSAGVRSWGQRLFFNKGGKRAPFMAERLSQVLRNGKTMNGESAKSLGEDANLLLMVQVPLKVKRRRRMYYGLGGAMSAPKGAVRRRGSRSGGLTDRSDVERAVLGHGKTEGPYTELAGLTISRDERFPVRVTVQYYLATSNGVISRADVARIHRKIQNVYEKGDYVGSLVVPETKTRRPTEWTGSTTAPRNLTIDHFPGLEQIYRDRGWVWPRIIRPIGIR